MENRKQTHHSTPLATRLDDLEIILNNLQGKHNLTQWGKNNKVQGVETLDVKLNLAVEEAHMKSSLMNGVTSLENGQSQLSLEHDSSTKIINGDAASSQESKRGLFFRSLPIFNSLYQSHKKDPQLHDKKDRQLPVNGSGIQGKPSKVQQKRKQLTNSLKQNGENKPSKEEKACKNGENKPIKDEKACKNKDNKPSKDEKACKNQESKPIKDESTCKNGENKPVKDEKACKNGETKPVKDEKACKKEKKRVPRNWFPQLLGC